MENDAIVLERVQELTWSLLDEDISDDEMSLLDNLLLSDDQARKHYLDCVQLHVDLLAHYASPEPKTPQEVGSKSPVLGFLNAGNPPLDLQLPTAGDVNS